MGLYLTNLKHSIVAKVIQDNKTLKLITFKQINK